MTATGGALAFLAPFDVLFTKRDVVEPDLIVVAGEQQDIVTEKNIQGSPALLVEVVSDSRMDRLRKRDLYAASGVAEYWIVDPDADRIEVYRHIDGGYGRPEILEPGDTLETPILPGLSIDLASFFAR